MRTMIKPIPAVIVVLTLLVPITVFSKNRQNKSVARDAEEICKEIAKIKRLPFKGDKSGDLVHDAIMDAGESAIPCLIKAVTDLAKKPDPRQAPTFSDVRVGDVAYFMFVRISKVGFPDMLPSRVQKQYQREGVYAYFRFVERRENRRWLQRKLHNWYQHRPNTRDRNDKQV